MKTTWIPAVLILTASTALADSPDSSFIKNAAEGGMSEVELGQLAQQKATNPAVKEFGAMMVTDHTAANEKLKAVAAAKQVSLPDSPSLMQKASKKKLDMMSGDRRRRGGWHAERRDRAMRSRQPIEREDMIVAVQHQLGAMPRQHGPQRRRVGQRPEAG